MNSEEYRTASRRKNIDFQASIIKDCQNPNSDTLSFSKAIVSIEAILHGMVAMHYGALAKHDLKNEMFEILKNIHIVGRITMGGADRELINKNAVNSADHMMKYCGITYYEVWHDKKNNGSQNPSPEQSSTVEEP